MTQPAAKKPSSRLIDFLIIGLLVFLTSQHLFPRFFGDKKKDAVPEGVVVTMADATLIPGQNPLITIQNNLPSALRIAPACPRPPFTIAYRGQGDAAPSSVDAGEPIVPCVDPTEILAGATLSVSLAPWKFQAFALKGDYELTLNAESASGAVHETIQVAVVDQNVLGKAYTTFIIKPFLNFLVLMGSILPGHDLGVAIILLTLAVKIILFIPTQKSLEGQKKMQLLQPQIEALRKKHADDAVKMNQEIMKVWKENKINPFQSCLPLLLQFPVLIGLYHVIRDTQDLALSQHLLYGAFQNLPWTFDTMFLGLNLTLTYALLFAPLLVVLQFIQMKLTFFIADKKKAKKVDEAVHQPDNPQDMQQKIMLYVLPLMIGFFAWKVPSAVSLYWGISTLFAIGQQLIVNREHLKVRA
jgi:YidC/Oxa1 family membrane protein insertase